MGTAMAMARHGGGGVRPVEGREAWRRWGGNSATRARAGAACGGGAWRRAAVAAPRWRRSKNLVGIGWEEEEVTGKLTAGSI